MQRQHAGFTLMEIVLVLVIIASASIVGLQLYNSLRRDADIAVVQANVDAIFNAMSDYYRAECYGQVQPNQAVTPGQLNPSVIAATFKVLDFNTDLIQRGFLDANKIVDTPVVSSSGGGTSGYKGYVAQFNKKTLTRQICTAGAISPNSASCTKKVNMGTVTVWQAQVAIELNNPATAGQYLSMLQGDCLSTLSGSRVLDCTSATTGAYVVWERTLTNAQKNGGSTYWGTMPNVKLFTQMYTNTSTGSSQNFLCTN